jgi:microcompartment protein CcmK/EutM
MEEIVIVVSGSSARIAAQTKNKPVDAAIIAIVDSLEMDGKIIYRKFAQKAEAKR